MTAFGSILTGIACDIEVIETPPIAASTVNRLHDAGSRTGQINGSSPRVKLAGCHIGLNISANAYHRCVSLESPIRLKEVPPDGHGRHMAIKRSAGEREPARAHGDRGAGCVERAAVQREAGHRHAVAGGVDRSGVTRRR